MAVIALTAVLLVLLWRQPQVSAQEAILRASNGSSFKEYCLVINSSWTNVSETVSGAVRYPLVNLSSNQLCEAGQVTAGVAQGAALLVLWGGCDVTRKARVAQELGAAALLIASNSDLVVPSVNNSDLRFMKIPLALMRLSDAVNVLKAFPQGTEVQLYSPAPPVFDLSALVMFVLAVFTVALGGFWSGSAEQTKCESGLLGDTGESRGEELVLYSPLKVLLFVAMMCVMLVLMYFFYQWLVYVILVVFCVASVTALFNCLDALLTALGCGTFSFSCCGRTVPGRSLLLAAVCITLTVVWGVFRNDDRWVWILQDLLGVAFCLNFMKTISLSNFKICVILLSLLLVYDVFFVFITPFLTPNGESIMVQVALGPAGGEKGDDQIRVPADPSVTYEKLPVVMRIPQFSALAQNLCLTQFSILGYGDIIIPGLLVSYCHRFDVWTRSSRKVYFLCCVAAYACGLAVTLLVMLLSRTGQPALLYLVPCTVLTSTALAAARRQLAHFWSGAAYQVWDETRKPLLSDGDAGVRSC